MSEKREFDDVEVAADATVGVAYKDGSSQPDIGPGSVVRAGVIVYDDVVTGPGFQTGHNALIRELTDVGKNVLVGTNSVIDGRSSLGDGVSLQTGAYVPSETTIADRVFLGPHATLLNDMYPVRADYDLVGPTLEDDVSIGANATVLPDVTVGARSFVAAGSVVTKDVPPDTLAVGSPATFRELPDQLQGGNDL